jgi:hypothetical protein
VSFANKNHACMKGVSRKNAEEVIIDFFLLIYLQYSTVVIEFVTASKCDLK